MLTRGSWVPREFDMTITASAAGATWGLRWLMGKPKNESFGINIARRSIVFLGILGCSFKPALCILCT